ncbi:MAG: STAS domain-containing protein [Candidatus Omnitrophica bacterium]|nr:STAS domain-containing protein [Candidatus Omnitrophota bacterium]MBU1870472.1 STAS domain-containing protein [Candidatus Omnitrophota bacterium]
MQIKSLNDCNVVQMEEKLDALTSDEVEKALMGLIDNGAKRIVCVFELTEYISSAGLRVLLVVAKKLKKMGGELVLCSLKPLVYKVLDMAGFISIFKIFGSEEEALKSPQEK